MSGVNAYLFSRLQRYRHRLLLTFIISLLLFCFNYAYLSFTLSHLFLSEYLQPCTLTHCLSLGCVRAQLIAQLNVGQQLLFKQWSTDSNINKLCDSQRFVAKNNDNEKEGNRQGEVNLLNRPQYSCGESFIIIILPKAATFVVLVFVGWIFISLFFFYFESGTVALLLLLTRVKYRQSSDKFTADIDGWYRICYVPCFCALVSFYSEFLVQNQ